MAKTSGGKVLHLQLPVKSSFGWDVLKEFTRQAALAVAALNPPKLTTTISKSRRVGKIFIGYLRSRRGATCIAPWSWRTRAHAPVSMPVNRSDLPGVTAAGFTLRELSQPPGERLNGEPHKVTRAHRPPRPRPVPPWDVPTAARVLAAAFRTPPGCSPQ